MKLRMYDKFTVDGVRRTDDGYLSAFARVARTGIQEYRGSELGRPELGSVQVYRPESEVFSADAMKSFAHRPVTLTHPKTMVNARNWKRYAKGQTGAEVVRDGEYVRVPMVMMDQGMIDAYEKKGVKELSMGYTCDLKWEPGVTPKGEHYDAMQTSIRGNHLAVVPAARGGEMLRIGDDGTFRAMVDRLKADDGPKDPPDDGDDPDEEDDEDDDYMGDAVVLTRTSRRTIKLKKRDSSSSSDVDYVSCPQCGGDVPADASKCPHCDAYVSPTKDHGEIIMKQVIVDGVPVDVATEQGAAIVDRHITKLDKKLKDSRQATVDVQAALDKASGLVKDAQTVVSAKDGEIAALKKAIADAEITPEKLDVMVKDRMAVIDRATPILGKTFAFDGLKVEDIRRAAVAVKLGDGVAKAMDDATIGGAFAALSVSTVNTSTNGTRQFADALRGQSQHVVSDANTAREQAFTDAEKRLKDSWKTPIKSVA